MRTPRNIPPTWGSDEEFLRNPVTPQFRPVRPSVSRRPRWPARWLILGTIAVVLLAGLVVFWAGRNAPGEADSSQGPPSSTQPSPALLAARELPVADSSSLGSYDRELFAWRGVDLDRNGCDTRNDVLRRDLTEVVVRDGTRGCKVDAGTLDEPYTGATIFFVVGGGPTNDGGVQIDHVVALANAWVSGADAWDSTSLQTFGNDPLNLLAVDGDANQSKGSGNASQWLPQNAEFHCEYVARQVAVKAAYSLSVTASELTAMEHVLASCPSQELPTAAGSTTP